MNLTRALSLQGVKRLLDVSIWEISMFEELFKSILVAKRVLNLLSRREKILVWLTILIRVALVSLDLVGIFLVGAVVSLLSGTVIADSSQFGQVLAWFSSLGFENGYAIILGIAVGFFVMKAVVSVGLNRITGLYLAGIEWRKSTQVFSTFLEFPLEKVEEFSAQNTVFTSTLSVTAATTKAILIGSNIIGEATLLLAISIYLMIVDLRLFSVLFLFFLLTGWVMNKFVTKSVSRTARRMHDSALVSQGIILDALKGFRQLTLSPNKTSFVQSFLGSRKTYASQSAEYQNVINLPRYITELAVMIAVGLLVLQRVSGDSISASVIAVFLAGIFRVISALLPLQSWISSWKIVQIESKNSLDLLLGRTSHQKKNTEVDDSIVPLSVEITDLSYRYDSVNPFVLKNVNLSIQPGSFVALIGKSGSGKSTLADLILGLRQPSEGEVLISGVHAELFCRMNGSKLAYVPQAANLFSGTLRQNISLNFGESTEIELEKISEALLDTDLIELASQLPNGLDTMLGAEAHSISGGELQRIAIARALYCSPRLLVLDEATSALDAQTQGQIKRTMDALKGKCTLVVIAHREETIELADVVIQINEGTVEIVKGHRD